MVGELPADLSLFHDLLLHGGPASRETVSATYGFQLGLGLGSKEAVSATYKFQYSPGQREGHAQTPLIRRQPCPLGQAGAALTGFRMDVELRETVGLASVAGPAGAEAARCDPYPCPLRPSPSRLWGGFGAGIAVGVSF